MENQSTIAYYTQGCKLNFSETSTISRKLNKEGYKKVDFKEVADIYVINTCSVTENADKKLKKIVKDTQKINKEAFVVAIGCYAQLQPEQIISTTGVDLVLGAKEKFKLFNYLDDIKKNDVKLNTISDNEYLIKGNNLNKIEILFKKIEKNND